MIIDKTLSVAKLSLSTVAVVALLAGGISGTGSFQFVGAALADETSDGEGGKKDEAPGNQGGQGQGSQGAQSGQDNSGGQGAGQGGPGEDSDAKGPQAGGPSDTSAGGGKPAWAQEGIPEVELGRLSVARSPDQVLDRAYAEAIAAFTPEMIALYSLPLDQMIHTLTFDWDTITIIDSPLQNLSLLRDALDGTSSLTAMGVTTDVDLLMAYFIGVASDKTVTISTDTVYALSVILGVTLTDAQIIAIAADAEAIRIAVLAGHG